MYCCNKCRFTILEPVTAEATEEVDEVDGSVEMGEVKGMGVVTGASGVMETDEGVVASELAGTNEAETGRANEVEAGVLTEVEVAETTELVGGDSVEAIGSIVVAETVDSNVAVD